jgi:hypothetical protein
MRTIKDYLKEEKEWREKSIKLLEKQIAEIDGWLIKFKEEK